jgi:hypothetical protein
MFSSLNSKSESQHSLQPIISYLTRPRIRFFPLSFEYKIHSQEATVGQNAEHCDNEEDYAGIESDFVV